MSLNNTTIWKSVLLIATLYVICFFLLKSETSLNTSRGFVSISSVFFSPPSPKYLSSNLAARCRLGNHLFEFASLYGISKHLNRTPVFWIVDSDYRNMFTKTKQVIPGLVSKFTVFEGKLPEHVQPTSFHRMTSTFDNPKRLENITDEYLHLSGAFYQSWKYFEGRRDEIISYLEPQKPNQFKILPKSNERNFITCIHTRRTDFVTDKRHASDPNFIRKAAELIENRGEAETSRAPKKRKKLTEKLKTNLKRKRVIFGDDMNFMKTIFSDNVISNASLTEVQNTTLNFISANSPMDDLLYSAQHCDSVLITAPVSTFGWWMGYLSKGDRVFYMDVTTVKDKYYRGGELKLDDFFLPKWTALKWSKDNRTVIETRTAAGN